MYLSVGDAAARYGVSVHSIWKWTKAGTFPKPVKLGPAATRWKEADLQEWELKRNGGGGVMRDEIIAKATELSREKEGPVALALTPDEAVAFRGEKEGAFVSVLALANVDGVPAYLGRDVPVEDGMDVEAITLLAMRAAINALCEKLRLLHAETAGSA